MATIEHIRKQAERIRLVSATPEYAQLLYEIFTGPNAQKFSPIVKTSVPELAERLRQSGRVFDDQASFYRFFGEFHDVLFGTFVVKNIERDKARAEVGFSLLEKWQGQGLGSALVYTCVAKVFAESTFDQLWATVSVTNEACRRLMESLHFENCGHYEQPFIINGEPVPQVLYQMTRTMAQGVFS